MKKPVSEIEEINCIFAIVSEVSAGIPYNTHHLDHIYRVLKHCQDILAYENASKMVVEAAACLHDLGRFFEDKHDKHEIISSQKAREILQQRNWITETIDQVCYAIETHRFSAGHLPETIEAKILQDADKLDALGAIGVIRVVSHSPDRPLYELNASDLSQSNQGKKFTLDHFYEKILKLPDQLHTARARELAVKRMSFTRHFLNQLMAELAIETVQS